MKSLRDEYDLYVERGELRQLFPELKGDWEQDREKFKKLHEDFGKALGISLTDFEEL